MRQLALFLIAISCFACATSTQHGQSSVVSTVDTAAVRQAAAVAEEQSDKLTQADLASMPAGAAAKAAKAEEAEEQNRKDALADFKNGAALGISVVLGSHDVVEDAVVVNNAIVVTKRAKDQPRATLEAHQLFTGNPFTGGGRQVMRDQLISCGKDAIDCPMFGVGPFAAIQTGDDNSISSAGFGLMLGLRSDPRRDSSFNIGLGLVWDTHVKALASGFKEGKALPTGETEVRFTEHSARRAMITLSFAF
jgi:hypothetical protein